MSSRSQRLLEEAQEGLDEVQRVDLVQVAGAFRGARLDGRSDLDCLRAASARYRMLHPDDVDEAVEIAVGRILSIARDYIDCDD